LRDDYERLLDIQEAINRLETEVPKRAFYELEPIVIAGILRYLQIIGEATAKLSEELKAKYPDVAWKAIARSRNVIVHQYFEVDMAIIQSIFEKDLPILKAQISDILQQEQH
jgi:uncharacterized protein with HEPN domain